MAELDLDQSIRQLLERARKEGYDAGYEQGRTDTLDKVSDFVTSQYPRSALSYAPLADDASIRVLNLSTRAVRILNLNDILYIRDLKAKSEADLGEIHQLGRKVLTEIKDRCRDSGISLRVP